MLSFISDWQLWHAARMESVTEDWTITKVFLRLQAESACLDLLLLAQNLALKLSHSAAQHALMPQRHRAGFSLQCTRACVLLLHGPAAACPPLPCVPSRRSGIVSRGMCLFRSCLQQTKELPQMLIVLTKVVVLSAELDCVPVHTATAYSLTPCKQSASLSCICMARLMLYSKASADDQTLYSALTFS